MNGAIKYVLFDIGGVLINFDVPLLVKNLSRRTKADPDQLLKLFSQEAVIEVETGAVGPEEFFNRRMRPVLGDLTYEEWITAWMDNYSINEAGWNLMTEYRDRGFTVCLLSNLAEYNTMAIRRKFPDFFSVPLHNFFSYDLGYHKPDTRIYTRVCELLNTAPKECFFLDDVQKNIDGAIAAGMQGIRFENRRIDGIREIIQNNKT